MPRSQGEDDHDLPPMRSRDQWWCLPFGTGGHAGLGGGIIAIITGLAMLALGWAPIVGALIGAITIALIGFLGCQVDSLLGALLENRGWLTKQQVNVLATGSGVLMCVILVLWGWLA